MWKYLTDDLYKEFLLSLNLVDSELYIKKLYAISNNIEDNYKVFKIKKSNGSFRKIYEPNGTLKYIQRLFNVVKRNTIDLNLRFTFWMLSLAVLMVFLSEPVLEGIPMIFEFLCLLLGIVTYYSTLKA